MPGPRLKAFAEEVFQQALSAVDPERSVREALQLTERFLIVRGVPHRLEPTSQLVVIALGKAAAAMVRGALTVLGSRVTRCVIVPKVDGWNDRDLAECRVIPGAHPVPDARSLEAGQALLEAVRGLDSTDLVLVLLSGGGSALAEVPRDTVTLDDLVLTTDELLRAGADIWLLNAVRRRLSAIKGGGLARVAAPARVVNLIVSDVLGNPLPVIASGPTVEPTAILEDVVAAVQRLGVWERLPERVRAILCEPESERITLANVLHTVILADVTVLVRAAAEACQVWGLPSVICGARYTGEAREFGRFWAALARSVRSDRQPWAPPVALVAGGELTVTVRGRGRGGRNTEMALAAALSLEDAPGITIASFASDGDDGTSGAAGAVVDATTVAALRAQGIDAGRALSENDSATVLERVNALVHTGLTGTNVNDLYLAIIE